MRRNRFVLHSATILGIVFFAFLAIGSTTSTPAVISTETEASVEKESVQIKTESNATVYHLPQPNGKPFEALGLVFATSVTKIDEKGQITSQEGIVTMLLREAQKLGGNDIYNLRVDRSVTTVHTTIIEYVTASSTSPATTKETTLTTETITLTGSALAIKYHD